MLKDFAVPAGMRLLFYAPDPMFWNEIESF